MKLILLFFISLFTNLVTSAQVQFQDHFIHNGTSLFTSSVKSADLDGDGDNDILAAMGSLSWFENTNGLGSFGPETIVNFSPTESIRSIYVADLDADGDNDIIFITALNKLGWHKNLDGNGNFSSEIIISTDIDRGAFVFAADLDDDGDVDILSSSENDNKIAWYENIDGLGNFGSQRIITTEEIEPSAIFATDIDGDGNIDLLTTSTTNNTIAWYRNTGQGIFDSQQIIADNIDNVTSVIAEDFNNDGFMDVVCAGYEDNTVSWFKNTDGLGNFGLQQIISTNTEYPTSVNAIDIDADGDFDVLGTSLVDNKIAWYENLDGLGSFGEQILISTIVSGPVFTAVKDLNGDGNSDILVAGFYDDNFIWFENLGVLGNEIYGNIKFDINSNGCDPNDYPIANMMVKTTNGVNSFSTFTQDNGDYVIYTNSGEFSTNMPSLPSNFTPTPLSHSSSFSGLNNSDIADFCVESIQLEDDLNISFYPLNNARPGFEASYQIVYKNLGANVISGNIELSFNDSKIIFGNSSEPISSQTSNSLVVEYENLMPFETRSINLNFDVETPPTTIIGDVLSFTLSINPISGDLTPENNIFEFDQIVVETSDPNDIQVMEGSTIYRDELDDYLHYIIRFQNTGAAVVDNVKITNWLTYNFDWSTLQIENISHPNVIKIVGENNVEFIFENIDLPNSSANEEASKGFIQYKIKPKSNLEVGDYVFNSSKIYFDFNPPFRTNTVITTVISSLSVANNELNLITIYPNPVNNILYMQSETPIKKIEILNEVGQQILISEKSSGIKSIDIDKLTPGLYFLNLINIDDVEIVKKFLKQ